MFAKNKWAFSPAIKGSYLRFFLLLRAIKESLYECDKDNGNPDIGRKSTKCTKECLKGITTTVVHSDWLTKDVLVDDHIIKL